MAAAAGAPAQGADFAGAIRSVFLGPKAEDLVLKSGILALAEALGDDGLLEFPRRPNGTPMITRQGFFERLLNKDAQASLQDCAAADAAAAEADVKRLNLTQCLAIRCKHLDFVPTGAGMVPKASFLRLVDKTMMAALAARILGDESKDLTEAHRLLVIRHVVLIYGANRELGGFDEPFSCDWWLLAVRGTRRYLHLPGCQVRTSAPSSGPVCCYRSYTVPNPRDPHHSRVFRWQALLVTDPGEWHEDAIEMENKARKTDRLKDASKGKDSASPKLRSPALKPKVAAAKPTSGASEVQVEAGAAEKEDNEADDDDEAPTPAGNFTIFGDFDVEDLFDEFDDNAHRRRGSTKDSDAGFTPKKPAASAPAGAQAGDNMDEFFDSLLADTLFEGPKTPGDASSAPNGAAAAADASPVAPGTSAEAAVAPAAVAKAQAPSPPAADSTTGGKAPPAAPPAQAAARAPPASVPAEAGSPHKAAVEKPAPAVSVEAPVVAESADTEAASVATVEAPEEEEEPPLTREEAKLVEVLSRFYSERKSKDKLGNVAKISRKYAGDSVVELWAQLAAKYSVAPPTAVQWLVASLNPGVVVQWPRGCVPPSAQEAVDVAAAIKEAAESEQAAELGCTERLRAALQADDLDAIGALTFVNGCADPSLRGPVWRSLLGCGVGGQGGTGEAIKEQRRAYRELRQLAAAPASADNADSDADSTTASSTSGGGGGGGGAEEVGDTASKSNGQAEEKKWDFSATKVEAEADAQKAWRDEGFFRRPEVAEALVNILVTHAWRCSRYISGAGEIAALMLFVMACGGAVDMADAEADAFWCFYHLMAEIQESLSENASLTGQVRRVHALLRAYDPPLAELLAEHGLGALPALRLGAGLLTRAGFALADCVRIWDSLLGDPRRFEFCDHVVVSLLLLSRGDMLQRQNIGGLAEAMLAAPRQVNIKSLLDTACAVCAFERRCPVGSKTPYPYRPPGGARLDVLDAGSRSKDTAQALEAAATKMSSLWGKVSVFASGAVEVGRSVAKEKMAQAIEVNKEYKITDTIASRVTEAVASAASAAESAATAASAALEAVAEAQAQAQQRADEEHEAQLAAESVHDDEATKLAEEGSEASRRQAKAADNSDVLPPKLVEATEELPPALVAVADEEPPQLVQLPTEQAPQLVDVSSGSGKS